MSEKAIEELIAGRSIPLTRAKRDGTVYLASIYGQIPILICWNTNYKKWACASNGLISFGDEAITHIWRAPNGYKITCVHQELLSSPLKTINDKVWDLLIECELLLDETAEIAQKCTEYGSSDLKKQCQLQLILSKKIHKQLEAIQAGDNYIQRGQVQ